jgi:hypothetical protein
MKEKTEEDRVEGEGERDWESVCYRFCHVELYRSKEVNDVKQNFLLVPTVDKLLWNLSDLETPVAFNNLKTIKKHQSHTMISGYKGVLNARIKLFK